MIKKYYQKFHSYTNKKYGGRLRPIGGRLTRAFGRPIRSRGKMVNVKYKIPANILQRISYYDRQNQVKYKKRVRPIFTKWRQSMKKKRYSRNIKMFRK